MFVRGSERSASLKPRLRPTTTVQGTVSAGQPYEHFVDIDSNDKPLVVTLAWTGPPAVLGTQSPIVNQLELNLHEQVFQRDWSTEANMAQSGNGLFVRDGAPHACLPGCPCVCVVCLSVCPAFIALWIND